MKIHFLTAAAVLLGYSGAALADTVITDDLIVSGGGEQALCVGGGCVEDMAFGNNRIVMRGITLGMLFDDTTPGSSTFPKNDWRLGINDLVDNGADYFAIEDVTGGTVPFRIDAGASSNSFYIDGGGDIGIGTSLPMADIHLYRSSTPTLRFEEQPFDTQPHIFDIEIRNEALQIRRPGSGALLSVGPEGTDNIQTGLNTKLGFGTSEPEGKLHTWGNGHQIIYFESADDMAVQVRFRTDSENRRFLATDGANNVKTQMQFKDDSIVFLGETVAQEWLNVSAAGITTAGPTCDPGPCDATFDPDAFEVPSIEDHAAYMWENQHLWAVGPTKPGAPFNLTQKAGGMLHELEVAHIYIEQLHATDADQKAQLATQRTRLEAQEQQMQTVLARLAALEGQP